MTMARWIGTALVAGLGLLPGAAWAAASAWGQDANTAARLVSAIEATGDAAEIPLGLHFKMNGQWKVYWRSPGDAGYPPKIDWSGSENLAGAEIAWPTPRRFSLAGLETLGYKSEVVLPIAARPATPGRPLKLRAAIEYLACDEVCIPVQAELALDLPAGPARAAFEAHLIDRYRSQVPGDGQAVGLTLERAEAAGRGKLATLRVTVRSAVPFANPDLYVEGPDGVAFSAPRALLTDNATRAVLELSAESQAGAPGLVGRELRLTLVDGERAAEKILIAIAGTAPSAAPAVSLWAALGLALLGGLILNLMPCVLPVLSLKLLGVVKHGGRRTGAVRLSFIASAAGIVTSFLLIGGSLAALKAGGASIGWGIQFQQPWFLSAMLLVVLLFASNLWGFFEIRLPRWIADLGEKSGHVHGLGGHFLTGGLATLLATPCSAPFLGTAVGFALARGTAEILLVFVALGVGLALPYLLVAAAPRLVTRMPKPGRWMVALRKALGFALAATGVWLLSVIDVQAGRAATAMIALLAGLGVAVLYARHRWPDRYGSAALGSYLLLAALAVILPGRLGPAATPPVVASAEDFWKPFEPERIAALVADKRLVFVDVTADWCITCQVNKKLVLGQDDIRQRLTAENTVAMKADWTRPSEAIAAYLASFGRYGIPFNAVYGPQAPEGIALPELLSREAVLDALVRAGGDTHMGSR